MQYLNELLKEAEYYVQLKNLITAGGIYRKVVNTYPQDYRGWWGLLTCQTRNFTYVEKSEINNYQECFKNVKSCCPLSQNVEYEKIYIDFLKKIVVYDAEDEMEQGKTAIKFYTQFIAERKQFISNINRASKINAEDYERNKEIISNAQKELKECQRKRSKNKIIKIIIGVFFLFGPGIIIGILLLISAFRSKESEAEKDLNQVINLAQEDIKNIEVINDGEVDIIKDIEEEIRAYQNTIDQINKHLSLGKEKFQEFWLWSRCTAVGIPMNIDQEIFDEEKNYTELLTRVRNELKRKSDVKKMENQDK